MQPGAGGQLELDDATREFYCRAMRTLQQAEVPFLVGGAYAFARYTGIERHTKDFDIFVRPHDGERALRVFEQDGCQTELTFPHWLGKAFCGDDFVDVIFSSGNGVAGVDEEWFANAEEGDVLGIAVKLCPPEEMIWQKAFIMERERFDGADVAHVLRARAEKLDWQRLLRRFGPDWRVLFSHLVLFGFIYPGERASIPDWVMRRLIERLTSELEPDNGTPLDGVCQGTLVSRAQYLIDVEQWGYHDARLLPRVKMNEDDVQVWTEAIDGEK